MQACAKTWQTCVQFGVVAVARSVSYAIGNSASAAASASSSGGGGSGAAAAAAAAASAGVQALHRLHDGKTCSASHNFQSHFLAFVAALTTPTGFARTDVTLGLRP